MSARECDVSVVLEFWAGQKACKDGVECTGKEGTAWTHGYNCQHQLEQINTHECERQERHARKT